MLKINYPVELSLTLCTGRYINVSLTYAAHVPPSFDYNDSPDNYNGYTDLEYVYKDKLNELEIVDLERRLKRYVEGIYNQYINEHKGNKLYKACVDNEFD